MHAALRSWRRARLAVFIYITRPTRAQHAFSCDEVRWRRLDTKKYINRVNICRVNSSRVSHNDLSITVINATSRASECARARDLQEIQGSSVHPVTVMCCCSFKFSRHFRCKNQDDLFSGLGTFSADCAIVIAAPASVLCTLTRIDDKISIGAKSSKRLRHYFWIDRKYKILLVGFDLVLRMWQASSRDVRFGARSGKTTPRAAFLYRSMSQIAKILGNDHYHRAISHLCFTVARKSAFRKKTLVRDVL